MFVTLDGSAQWVTEHRVSVTCGFDLANFPYDQHYCSMKFGSWTYDGSQVAIVSDKVKCFYKTFKVPVCNCGVTDIYILVYMFLQRLNYIT